MAYIPDNLRRLRIKHKISRTAKEFYEAFCEFADQETGFTFIGIKTIAAECEIRPNSAKNYVNELLTAGWIIETFGENGYSERVKGFSVKTKKTGWLSRSERNKKIDKNFVKTEDSPNEIDKKIVNDDKNFVEIDKKIVNPIYKGINQPINQQSNQEKKDIYSAHEAFSSEGKIPIDENHTAELEETFIWLQQKKNLKKLPRNDWINLFADLETEEIPLDKFKDFYNWVENLDWVTGIVSVKLLYGQIEHYKNREIIEAKNLIKRNGGKNGTSRQNGQESNHEQRSREAGERIEFDRAASEYLESQGIIQTRGS